MAEQTIYDYITKIALEPSMVIQNIVIVLDILLIFGLRNKKKLEGILTFAAMFLLVIAINGAWHVILGQEGSFFLSHFILIVGYALFQNQNRLKPALISAFLFYGIEMAMISFSGILPLFLEFRAANSWIEIFLRNGTIIFSLLVAGYFRWKNILQMKKIPSMSAYYAAAMGILTVILSYWCQLHKRDLNEIGSVLALLSLGFMLLIALFTYYLNYSVCLYYDTILEVQTAEMMSRNDGEILKISRQTYDDIRTIRHDMKNHFSYMNVLLRDQEYERLKEYFEDLEVDIVEPLSRIDCGNPSISAILNLEATKARSMGFRLDCRVLVMPDLPFSSKDICGLLTNLIDNALEACERFAIPDAVVEVGMNQKPNMLYISILNPVNPREEKEKMLSLKTTKKSAGHGYGSKIVELIVKKYNGEIVRNIHKDKYIVDVMLDMNWDGE